jgi:hypothetical protein
MSFICAPKTDASAHGIIQLDSLTLNMCKHLLSLKRGIEPISAKVGKSGGGYEQVSTIRDVLAYPITSNDPYPIIQSAVEQANETFRYDLSGMLEGCALLKYRAPSNGYDWHVDIAEGLESLRKISIIINLNDDYEGGDFEAFSQGVNSIKLRRGDVIAFSSFMPHRITPITKGERWSLVAWVSGPCFK